MRIGILGAGNMGCTHAACYQQLRESNWRPDLEIAAIVGRDESRVKESAAKFGVAGLTDPQRVLDDDSIDVIDLCYPSFLHREYAIAALERGKHVFCETPIALTLEDAEAMIAAAQRSKRLLMVALLMRQVAELIYLREAVRSGVLGEPFAVYAYRLSSAYGSPEKMHYAEPALELLTFEADYLNWFFGLPRAVAGAGGVTGPRETFDHFFVALDFDKVRSLVEISRLMPTSFPFSTGLRLVCEVGVFEYSVRSRAEWQTEAFPEIALIRYPKSGSPEVVRIPGHDP